MKMLSRIAVIILITVIFLLISNKVEYKDPLYRAAAAVEYELPLATYAEQVDWLIGNSSDTFLGYPKYFSHSALVSARDASLLANKKSPLKTTE